MSDDRWTRVREGRVIHADTDAHARLVARTLGVEVDAWERVLDRYATHWRVDQDDLQGRARALTEAFAPCAGAGPSEHPGGACPVCGASPLVPAVERRNDDAPARSVWARCGSCGHGALVAGGVASVVYDSGEYYLRRDPGGAGYDDYLAERAYRERKGAILLDRIAERSPPGRGALTSLLEVGSGFGYTRHAGVARGMRTSGVDVSPHAREAARSLYGFQTFTGTLADALAAPSVARVVAPFDLVLYQFVLEHLTDPVAELRTAASTLDTGGVLAVLVPSMDALELDVFTSAYRSLRRDHLHLFSRGSLERTFVSAGLRPVSFHTDCSLHLLAGFLSDGELHTLYASGRGPDLLGLATKERP